MSRIVRTFCCNQCDVEFEKCPRNHKCIHCGSALQFECWICGNSYTASYAARHQRRSHPGPLPTIDELLNEQDEEAELEEEEEDQELDENENFVFPSFVEIEDFPLHPRPPQISTHTSTASTFDDSKEKESEPEGIPPQSAQSGHSSKNPIEILENSDIEFTDDPYEHSTSREKDEEREEPEETIKSAPFERIPSPQPEEPMSPERITNEVTKDVSKETLLIVCSLYKFFPESIILPSMEVFINIGPLGLMQQLIDFQLISAPVTTRKCILIWTFDPPFKFNKLPKVWSTIFIHISLPYSLRHHYEKLYFDAEREHKQSRLTLICLPLNTQLEGCLKLCYMYSQDNITQDMLGTELEKLIRTPSYVTLL